MNKEQLKVIIRQQFLDHVSKNTYWFNLEQEDDVRRLTRWVIANGGTDQDIYNEYLMLRHERATKTA